MKKKITTDRNFYYLVIKTGAGKKVFTWVKKRDQSDIWKNLYDFPLIETSDVVEVKELQKLPAWKKFFGKTDGVTVQGSMTYGHKLSHRNLRICFIEIHARNFKRGSEDFIKIPLQDLKNLPVPRVVEKYLEESDFLDG